MASHKEDEAMFVHSPKDLLTVEVAALKYLAAAEFPKSGYNAHPHGRSQVEESQLFWQILMRHRVGRVRNRLEAERARELEESRRLEVRVRGGDISEQSIIETAREEILTDLMLIKAWISEGKDPLVEYQKFIEK